MKTKEILLYFLFGLTLATGLIWLSLDLSELEPVTVVLGAFTGIAGLVNLNEHPRMGLLIAIAGVSVLIFGLTRAVGAPSLTPVPTEIVAVTSTPDISATPLGTIIVTPTETPVVPTATATATATTTNTPTLTPTLDPNVPPPNPTLGATWVRPIDNMTMVYVPAGSFLMGSVAGDPEANVSEFPQHEVSLSGFWIDQTEVTNAQFAAFMNIEGNQPEGDGTWYELGDDNARIVGGGNPFQAAEGFADHPATLMMWYGANAYCSLYAGGQLPTEAQWEYAARGTANNRYPWGVEQPTCELAQFSGCDGDTSPVGSLPDGASWVGAFDMAGNVREWVNDWYASDYYMNSPMEDPLGPTEETSRKVLRGGGWVTIASNVRAASRNYDNPSGTFVDFGFRCVAVPGVR